ncbi:MAG TPA: hypothetical protein VMT00_07515 [Thermoanaerobaculia bacterium]|nr:hypothetical protein [Thermoanaerobaculia bacterium]
MSGPMTKEQAREWKRRWDAVAERRRAEVLRETYEERFRSLASLMASTSLFDMRRLDDEDLLARRRWARLQALARR